MRMDPSDPSSEPTQKHKASPGLRRVLGTPLLVFYGLGVIIGAGIYVLVGTVIAAAGEAAPWAFILAGALAALTGLSYAELAVRFPEAAGAAAYVKEAFGSDRLSQLTGLAVAAVVVVSSASIARGSIGYVQVFLPWPGPLIAGLMVLLFTAIACLQVRESVGLAATMTVVEIGGLLMVVAAGWHVISASSPDWSSLVPRLDLAAGSGLVAGAFLAFFAFIGFENLANMAEEASVPERSLPRAIILSLGLSGLLYAAVTAVAILAISPEELAASSAPLLLVAGHAPWFSPTLFTAIAIIAVANGVLIEIVMLGRLLYGMARRRWLPAWLGEVARRQHTPARATICGGVVILVLTVALPFESLVAITSTITLLVFAIVNLALWQLQRQAPRSTGFRVPRFVPPLASAANVGLVIAQLWA